MVIGLALSLLVLLVPATLLVRVLWPRGLARAPLVMELVLGMGLGLGASSVLLFLWLRAFGPLSGAYIGAEASLALCAAAALLYAWRRTGPAPQGVRTVVPGAGTRLARLCAGAFFISAACVLASAVAISAREPHGAGDASSIWNLIARFIYRGGDVWADALARYLNWTHPDYPLLVPLSVARLWAYGGETQAAPALLGLLFMLGTLGLVVSSVSLLSTRTQGYLAGLVLLEPFFFFRTATFQYADTPLGFFLLAALVLFRLHDREPGGRGLLLLAGAMAGFAAWTKNEGLLVLLAVVAGRLFALAATGRLRSYPGQLVYFAAGAAPALLAVLYFKAAIAPANDLVAGQGARATAERLSDLSRYGLILKAFVNHFTGFRKWYAHPTYLLAVYAWLLGLRTERAGRAALLTPAAVLGFMLAGYFFIYVTTPRDLEWQLTFSLDRLLIQLWPSFVLLFFLSVRSPEEALARIPGPAKG